MPNGDDANLSRLEVCIAVYHARFGAWPTHARFTPWFLWDIARILGPQQFEHLCDLVELRTERGNWEHGISVGGKEGLQRYDHVDGSRLPHQALDEARQWLALGRGLGGY